MIYPLAIATDGLLDKRYLPGIATRGYLWAPAGALQYIAPALLLQPIVLPTPALELLERLAEIHSAATWAEQPYIYPRFQQSAEVSIFLHDGKRLTIKYFPAIHVTADWIDDEIDGSD